MSAPKRLEDAADIGILQREAELDAQKAEAHVPDLPEIELGFLLHFLFLLGNPIIVASSPLSKARLQTYSSPARP
jgi:hypothetical protein